MTYMAEFGKDARYRKGVTPGGPYYQALALENTLTVCPGFLSNYCIWGSQFPNCLRRTNRTMLRELFLSVKRQNKSTCSSLWRATLPHRRQLLELRLHERIVDARPLRR
jgi:hypothetical protein